MQKGFEDILKKEINDSFDKNAEVAKYAIEYNWKPYLDYFLEYFLPLKSTGGKLLDVGSGTGLVIKELLDKNLKIYGVDFSKSAIEYAKKQNLPIDFQYASIYELPFGDETFDYIICLGVFQTVEYPENALKELARVLKRGGTLVVRTLNSLSISSMQAQKANPDFNFYNPFVFRQNINQMGLEAKYPKGIYVLPKSLKSLHEIILQWKIYKLLNLFFPVFSRVAHSFYIEGVKK